VQQHPPRIQESRQRPLGFKRKKHTTNKEGKRKEHRDIASSPKSGIEGCRGIEKWAESSHYDSSSGSSCSSVVEARESIGDLE
jgi:hypothetical protein